jgi:class 3 adenylate cyclase
VTICPSCGRTNPADARFCNACGTALAGEAARPREERKVVTVLFADLVGFTARAEQLDPEDVRALLSPYHRRLRTELERFGGTVEKFIGDAVMALFGAPRAHEDDAERAVRAALAIRDWVLDEEQDLQLRIGVNTGPALVAVEARVAEGEGMASGDVVNAAARLQAAAPVNGILVGEATYRATTQAIDYREVDAVRAKGKSEPIHAWEALTARARVGTEAEPSTPFVGRQRERTLLVDAFEHMRQEQAPQLVTVIGVPGIGKSRLVGELLAVVESDEELISWRRGRSLPYGDGITLWALAEIVKAQAGILESDAVEDTAQKLSTAVADAVEDEGDRTWIERQLRPLVGLAGAGDGGGDRRGESFAAWRRFLEALAEQRPLVLVFEDLHWADDDLLDFVDDLVEWAEPVPLLVVATARPELLERRPGWGGGKRNALTISLAPLPDEDTARVIGATLDQSVLPAETQAALLARAGGNPLYAEQYARMLADEAGTRLDELPETVHALIAARLDMLPPPEKELLQKASVLGKVFWVGALVALGAGDDVHGLLQSLARKEFVRRERRSSVGGEREYAFAHLLVRDVAYDQIPRAARADKHRLAAEWLEALAAERSDDRSEMLAHHYLAALELGRRMGQPQRELVARARAALTEAADRALALGALGAAIRLYSEALELGTDDDPDRPLLLLHRAEATLERGGVADLSDVRTAASAFAAAGDPEHAAAAEMLCALTCWLLGRRADADEHAARALVLVEHAPASPAKATVLAEAARLAMVASEDERAIALGTDAHALAEELGLLRLEASTLVTRGTAKANSGREDGRDDVLRGLEVAREAKAPQQLNRAYNNLAEIELIRGRFNDAVRFYDEMRAIAGPLGMTDLRWLDAQDASVRYELGQWDTALRLLEPTLAAADAGSPHYLESAARTFRGLIRYGRGDAEGGLADAARGNERARRAKDFQALGPSLGAYAMILVQEERTREASAVVDELLETAVRNRSFPHHSWITMLMWPAAWLGRGDAFLELTEERQAWAAATVAAAVVRGEFVRAAELLAQMGAATHEAHARLHAARALVEAGQRAAADQQLAHALAFFRRVGATRYIREAEVLLAASA